MPLDDLTPRETLLLQLLREREERIQQLKDEIARLKGEKGKPKIKPSRLEGKQPNPKECSKDNEDNPISKSLQKRPGSKKRKKTAQLLIHETKIIQPTQEIPPGSEFKRYQDYTVQELMAQAS